MSATFSNKISDSKYPKNLYAFAPKENFVCSQCENGGHTWTFDEFAYCDCCGIWKVPKHKCRKPNLQNE